VEGEGKETPIQGGKDELGVPGARNWHYERKYYWDLKTLPDGKEKPKKRKNTGTSPTSAGNDIGALTKKKGRRGQDDKKMASKNNWERCGKGTSEGGEKLQSRLDTTKIDRGDRLRGGERTTIKSGRKGYNAVPPMGWGKEVWPKQGTKGRRGNTKPGGVSTREKKVQPLHAQRSAGGGKGAALLSKKRLPSGKRRLGQNGSEGQRGKETGGSFFGGGPRTHRRRK